MPGSFEGSRLGPLIGASILSSVGSLPLHLVPLIVATLIADSRASVANAGWLATAILAGQLSTALALPALRIFHVRQSLALGSAAMLVAGLATSTATNYPVLLFGWFVVGQCCGLLSYIGAMAASQYASRTFAFSLRLAIILIVAGLVSSVLQAGNMFASYLDFLVAFVVIIVPVLALGFTLRCPMPSPGALHSGSAPTRSSVGPWGLVAVYCFFVGQTGFLAFVVQQAIERGMSLASTAWSLAAMKLAAGIWILCSTYFEPAGYKSEPRFLRVSMVLIAAIATLAYSRNPLVFFSAFLTLEIALNKLSARLQAAVVAARPEFSGPWLTATMLLGAASGPPLNGFMISIGLDFIFVAIALFSALVPPIWQRLSEPISKPLS